MAASKKNKGRAPGASGGKASADVRKSRTKAHVTAETASSASRSKRQPPRSRGAVGRKPATKLAAAPKPGEPKASDLKGSDPKAGRAVSRAGGKPVAKGANNGVARTATKAGGKTAALSATRPKANDRGPETAVPPLMGAARGLHAGRVAGGDNGERSGGLPAVASPAPRGNPPALPTPIATFTI